LRICLVDPSPTFSINLPASIFIRIRDAAGAFRVLYVAKFDEAVYVLHCFQKKTQRTSKADLNLAALRYRDLLKELGQ